MRAASRGRELEEKQEVWWWQSRGVCGSLKAQRHREKSGWSRRNKFYPQAEHQPAAWGSAKSIEELIGGEAEDRSLRKRMSTEGKSREQHYPLYHEQRVAHLCLQRKLSE